MKHITFNEQKFALTAPIEGEGLGKIVLSVPPNTVFTLAELDVLRDRLAFVHTSIEHIQKHGLLPILNPTLNEVTKP